MAPPPHSRAKITTTPRYGAVDADNQRPPRINGFSPPMTQNQTYFLVGNTAAVAVFYLTIGLFVLRYPSPALGPLPFGGLLHALLTAHAATGALGFCAWLFVELHDPSLPSLFGSVLPATRKWTASKYVSEHRKPIEGLDHFCSWLNVAIARSNYIPFFVLTCCGVVQYSLQALTCALLLTLWHPALTAGAASPEDPEGLVAHAGVAVVALGSLGVGFPFAMLLVFHLTLLRTGETTYTYIQNAQKKEYRARKAMQKQLRQQAGAASYASGGTEGGGGGGRGGGAAAAAETTPITAAAAASEAAAALEGLDALERCESPPPGQLQVTNQKEMWDP